MAEPVVRTHLLRGGEVLTPSGWRTSDLAIDNGVIADGPTAGAEEVDVTALKIVPGFIDLQINGGWGHDFQQDPASMWRVAKRLVEMGVTSFLPTLTTDGYMRRREAFESWRDGRRGIDDFVGAEPVGLHLEGPWLAPSRHGAHSRELLQPIPAAPPDEYHPEDGVRLVTLAPELPGALEMATALRSRGVVASCGHSEATADQAAAGFEAGFTMGTHLFNAMSGLHHRNTGLAAALLLHPEMYFGLIVDGEHVDRDMVKLAWRLGRRRLIAVSDAVSAMGSSSGANRSAGAAHRLYDGTLAGSTVGLDTAVRNLMAFVDCSLADAVATVSEAPARCLGLWDRGRIDPGRRADVVALDDEGYVRMTFARGALVWDRR
ncbi:MAG: N-acetylglucosamine-6-phosphate deacetylase [Actinomycetota bacterium]